MHSFTRRQSHIKDPAALAVWLLLSTIVAGVSGVVTLQNVRTWYPTLVKPPFNPPNWIFGPVWSVLYITMAIAAWRIWRMRGQANIGVAVSLYLAQMALNFTWSFLFFGQHQVGAALCDIVGLIVLLIATTAVFWQQNVFAGALMIPYVVWVLFAALLNYAIWRLN